MRVLSFLASLALLSSVSSDALRLRKNGGANVTLMEDGSVAELEAEGKALNAEDIMYFYGHEGPWSERVRRERKETPEMHAKALALLKSALTPANDVAATDKWVRDTTCDLPWQQPPGSALYTPMKQQANESVARGCTETGFRPLVSPWHSHTDACALLARKGVKKILMVGDSGIRHMFQAMTLILSGDYAAGSLQSEPADDCQGRFQWNQNWCRGQVINRMMGCDGQVEVVNDMANGNPHLGVDAIKPTTRVVWGAAHHPVWPGRGHTPSKHGIPYNAATVMNTTRVSEILFPDCEVLRAAELSRLTYVESHFRLLGHAHAIFIEGRKHVMGDWERNPEAKLFGRATAKRIHEQCGAQIRLVDPFEMSKQAVFLPPTTIAKMTFDGAHWGREINLAKAQMILNSFV